MGQITAKIILYTYDPPTKKGFSIKVLLTKDRKTKPIHLKIHSKKEDWNFETNRPNSSHPEFEKIYKKVNNVDLSLLSIVSQNCTIEQAIEIIEGTAIRTKFSSLSEFAELYFDELRSVKRIGTAENYKTGLAAFKNYLMVDEVFFTDVTYANLKAFRTYKEKIAEDPRKTASTIHNYFRGIRALWNEAARRDKEVLNLEYPFKVGLMPKLKKRPVRRSAEKTLFEYLYTLEPAPYSITFHAKNLSILCFLLGGIDFVDLSLLTWSNIKDGRLKYYRHKLQDGYQINNLIVPEANEILSIYQRPSKAKDSDRIFPFIPLVTDPLKYKDYKNFRTRIYRGVRRLCSENEDLKNEAFNTKYPRATFSTTGKRMFIDRELIKEMMGHESQDEAEDYKGEFELSEKDQAILRITALGI